MKSQKSNVPNAAVNLHLNWCSYEAAKYAVEHWHYSRSLSSAKNVYMGVWEGGKFIGIRMLKRQSPGLRLLISMADPKHGHIGSIYQAMGWIYTGETKSDVEYFYRGEWRHHRTVTSSTSAKGLPARPLPAKHRYLFPLDDETRKRILPLAKPYPKRAVGDTRDTLGVHPREGVSTTTTALQPR